MRPPSVSTSAPATQTVPQFFFPKKTRDSGGSLADRLCHRLALEDIDRVSLNSEEMLQLAMHFEAMAATASVSDFQKRLLATYAPPTTGMTLVDRFIRERKTLSLSYDAFRFVVDGEWKCSPSLARKLKRLLPVQCFLSLMHPDDRMVNALDLLSYLSEVQLSLRVARHIGELTAASASTSVSEREYSEFIARAIQHAVASKTVDVPPDLADYYQLICTRALVLPHLVGGSKSSELGLASVDQLADCTVLRAFVRFVDVDMRSLFDTSFDGGGVYGCPGFFDPAVVLNLHKQYLQLDTDRNGLLSASELRDFGKKRAFLPPTGPKAGSGAAEPTHDLTHAFVAQVFCHVPSFDGELDYRAYMDFALAMMDKASVSALRFFWDVLDVQQQGFLDAFTLDFFLRSLVDRIRVRRAASGDGDGDEDEEDGKSSVPTIEQLRTQVLDAIGPVNPARITWTDLCRCRVGHTVVRILTDYVAYRAYEASGGRLPSH